MSVLGNIIKEKTPKFNRVLAEGICYHKIKTAVEWIDELLRFSVESHSTKHLNYLGCRSLTPEELFVLKFKTSNTALPYDLAMNTVYAVEFSFQYADYGVRKEVLFMPYMHKGNTFILGSKEKLIMPMLADKVISVGRNNVFIHILIAKHTFTRMQHRVYENGMSRNVPIILSDLYKNPSKKYKDTTKAKSNVMLYMLANYGYTATMMQTLGFVPEPIYDDIAETEEYNIYSSTGVAPKSWIGGRNDINYKANRIKFKVPKNLDKPEVLSVLGNVLYTLDHFPGKIGIHQLDDLDIWAVFIGEIILTGEHGVIYRRDQMRVHFEGLRKPFEINTKRKLKYINIDASDLVELLVVIFMNYNTWVAQGNSRSLYFRKTLEVEPFVLSRISSNFARLFFDINKEELKRKGEALTEQEINSLFKKYIRTNVIFNLRKDKQYVTSVEDGTDNYLVKKTAFLVMQEGNFTNVSSGKSNTSTKHPLSASMATFGSILNLSKDNPNPSIRLNFYGNIDPVDSTVLPIPDLNDIVTKTEAMLEDVHIGSTVTDISEENDLDVENDDDDLIDMEDYVNEFENDDF